MEEHSTDIKPATDSKPVAQNPVASPPKKSQKNTCIQLAEVNKLYEVLVATMPNANTFSMDCSPQIHDSRFARSMVLSTSPEHMQRLGEALDLWLAPRSVWIIVDESWPSLACDYNGSIFAGCRPGPSAAASDEYRYLRHPASLHIPPQLGHDSHVVVVHEARPLISDSTCRIFASTVSICLSKASFVLIIPLSDG